jgi:putative ABC transport system substrate-binding protein
MKRREFFKLAGGAAVWPLTARAQQPTKLPTVGFLGASTVSAWSLWVAAFVQRLRELGWTEGRTIAIEYRWAEGRTERYAEIAAEFVRLKVDVIVTVGSAAVTVKQATAVIPIVFAAAADPLGSGLVASLARPGGNVTGLSMQSTELVTKRCELLREILPALRRMAVMGNAAYPAAVLEMRDVTAAARSLGLEMYATRSPFVEQGGLMAYGPNNTDLFRRAGDYVDKILRGAKPGDIPVEQPTKFELVINLTTAKALGVNVPPSMQARADEMIE